jgi:aspartate-semialdehyde dehydrogenase
LAKFSTRRLALVGAETLLGREILEVLEKTSMKVAIRSFSATAEGNFAEQEGEAIFRQPLDVGSVGEFDAVLIAGTQPGANRCYELVRANGNKPPIIDATGLLDAAPEARIAAPTLDTGGDASPPSGSGKTGFKPWLFVLAHPAATALALLFSTLSTKLRWERAVVDLFEPASERGKRGITELQQQTTSLLSFRTLEKEVFDAQLSFNLLPVYGEQVESPLDASEQRIEKHLATLLSRCEDTARSPMPSLRLIQAPVFHGYSASVWIEFSTPVTIERLRESLASAQIEIRASDEEVPTNVGVAGQSGIQVGDMRIDHNNPRAVWLWMAADNLRMRADALEELLLELEASQ